MRRTLILAAALAVCLLAAAAGRAALRPSLYADFQPANRRSGPTSVASTPPLAAACADDRALEPGMEVILGRHLRLAGAGRPANWVPTMDAFVGARARVEAVLPERDSAGCAVAHVDADGGRWSWRIAEMEILTARPGWPDWASQARKMLATGDADGSGSLDDGEVAALDCALLAEVDGLYRAGTPVSLRVAFGFQPGAARYRGDALGIPEAARASADSRLAECGVSGAPGLGGPTAATSASR